MRSASDFLPSQQVAAKILSLRPLNPKLRRKYSNPKDNPFLFIMQVPAPCRRQDAEFGEEIKNMVPPKSFFMKYVQLINLKGIS